MTIIVTEPGATDPTLIEPSPVVEESNGRLIDSFNEGHSDAVSVLAPIPLTSSRIESIWAGGTTLPEDSSPVWNSATTYDLGARVHVPDAKRVYESAQGGNVGRDPAQPSNQFNAAGVATWWIDLGPTNRAAMFDSVISTPTAGASPFEIILRPGAFNGIAMFGLDADHLDIEVTDPDSGAVVYSYDAPLEGSAPVDYYEYFFEQFKPQTQFIATGIEPYAGARVRITLTKATGLAGIGMLAVGDLKPLGVPQRGASVEPVDYSYVSTDQFGNTVVKRRSSATGMSVQARMDIDDANTVLNTVKDLLGVPVVVIGSRAAGYEAMTVFGLLSGRLQYDTYAQPSLNISVKGLI